MIQKLIPLLVVFAALAETTSCRASHPAVQTEAPAADIITRTVRINNSFNAVKASSVFNVEIKQGPAKVEITSSAEAIDATRFDVIGKTLSISLTQNSSNRNGYPEIKVRISMPEIKLLDGGGAANFTIKGTIDVKDLKVKGSGACNFHFDNVACTDFEADLSGAANVDIPQLNCDECDLELSGGSSIEIEAIVCTELSAETSGAGDISISNVKCNDLDADSSGGSKINISGIDATQVECDASGAAHISVEGKCDRAELKASGASKISARKLQHSSIITNKSSVATIRY